MFRSGCSRLYSFFTQIPNPLSSITNCLTHPRFQSISSSILLVGLEQILDFIMTQKMNNDHVDWGYYSETPSRIVWISFLALTLGYNLEQVVRTIRADQQEDSDNHISARTVISTCVTYTTSLRFAELALTTPINSLNAGYMVGSSLLHGSLMGTVAAGGCYFLQRLNFSIRPVTAKHVGYLSAGILLKTVEELLDYMCTQMIKENELKWDSLISPRRLLAWHAISISMQGLLYGVAAISIKKYSQTQLPERDIIRKIRNIILTVSPVATFVSDFLRLSLTTPINLTNTPYIFSSALIQGMTIGMVMGANSFVVLKLAQFPEPEIAPLDQPYTPLTANSFLSSPSNRRPTVLPEPSEDPQREVKSIYIRFNT